MAKKKTSMDKKLMEEAKLSKELKEAVLEKANISEAKELERKDDSSLKEKLDLTGDIVSTAPKYQGRLPERFQEQLVQSLKKQIEDLEKEKKTLETSLKSVTEDRDKLRNDYEELKKTQSASSDSLQRDISQLQTDKEALQKELNLVKGRLSTSFTSQELASYLNEAITDFNNKISQASDTVDYTIGNMDVGLKAQIVKQNDKLGFITTSTEGVTALSEIRFTIAATPRS